MSQAQSRPESLAQEALRRYEQGDLTGAIEAFSDARDAYTDQGNQVKAAEMANNLAVALLRMGQPQEAYDLLVPTPDIFQQAGAVRLEAQAYGNLGAALEELGDAPAAERAYSRAAQLFEGLGAEEELGYTLQALSRLQLKKGRPFQALASMQSAIEVSGKPGVLKRFLRSFLDLPRRLLNR